jgi:hypothetical protein
MNSMSVGNDLIADWQPQHEVLFGRHAIKLQHRLANSGLFTRQALAALIERCPQHDLGLEAMDGEGSSRRLFGELGGVSGNDAIAAIERGRMWMNIRRVMDWAPEYRQLLDKVFNEFEARMPGLKTFKRNIGVLISSPNMQVNYHADIQGQSLWQISGVKSVHLYPATDVFVDPRNIEKILLRETTEQMPYHRWFDEHVTVFDLHPGEMLTWPLYAPHRVVNHDCLNVSVTMEHWTDEIWRSYAVHYGNGVLRRTLGLGNPSTRADGLSVYPKAAAALAWKKFGKQTVGDVVKRRQFKLDRVSPNGRVALAA